MNHELKFLVKWLRGKKLSLNESKKAMLVFRPSNKNINPKLSIKLNKFKLKPCNKVKYLGILIDENLNWNAQIENLLTKL